MLARITVYFLELKTFQREFFLAAANEKPRTTPPGESSITSPTPHSGAEGCLTLKPFYIPCSD